MDRTYSRSLFALAICLALTLTVSADTITVNYGGQAQAGSVQYNLSSGAGSWATTSAGFFKLNDIYATNPYPDHFPLDPLAAANGSILAFCIQLEETISTAGNPIPYEVVDLDKGRTPEAAALGVVRARQIDTLFTLAFGATGGINDPVSAVVAQAAQVAIWEIAYETSGTLDTTSNGTVWFRNAGTSVLSTADGWLSTINGMTFDDTYQPKHFLWAMNNVGRQDFVIQTPGSPAEEQVPEPATIAMVGMALLGLGALRRKMAN